MANGFNAGDLTLSIGTSAAETLKVLDAIIGRLDLIEKGLGGIKKNSNIRKSPSRTPKSNNGLAGFAKLGVNIYMLRRMGREMANLVQAGSNYMETLNLWQVAMRGNLDVADQFINKMQKAYGISSKTLMNAQAVFKNMIGSLGQISDQTAYALSEALVQMSADYASLYNRTLESAFQNMQSMLAGQVRPIRSAGLDMTETTLYQFYQQLGGTKSMRQLNRTEKQLLSILAVYKQMGSAGALGDMSKTLNQFANQSRMMTEYWAELKTWSGLILKDLLEDWQVLTYINAALITVTEIIKAIAKSRGIGEENFVEGLLETTEATNDEVDELQGKLLDFDKFRSLKGAGSSPLAIDEKLLEAITGYSSKIDQAQNAAQKLAETWLTNLGYVYDTESGTWKLGENISEILKVAIEIGKFLSQHYDTLWEIVGLVLPLITHIIEKLSPIMIPIYKIFNNVFAIVEAIVRFLTPILDSFIDLSMILTPILEVVNGIVWLVSVVLIGAIETINWLLVPVLATFEAISKVVQTIAELVRALFQWDWGSLGKNLSNIWGSWKSSDFANTRYEMPSFASGASDIDSGTIFRAGEFGKTEAVYTGSNGKTNVANIQQMKTAYTQALNEWWRTAKNDIPEFEGASDSGLYTVVSAEARRRGQKFAKV
jgi:phage-related protein